MAESMNVAELFTKTAEDYDALGVEFFRPLAERVLQMAEVTSGDEVLDVGCGRGAVLFAASRLVGAHGAVTGIDVAPGMVRHLEADIRTRGLSNATVALADATATGLADASVDVVVGSMSLFLMPDPGAAIAELARVLRPGGRMVFSLPVFGAPDGIWPTGSDPMVRAVEQVEGLPERMHEVRWSEAPGAVEQLMAESGLTGVEVTGGTVPITGPSPEALVAWTRTHGARTLWDALPESLAERVELELLEEAASFRGEDGLYRRDAAVRYVRADRPVG